MSKYNRTAAALLGRRSPVSSTGAQQGSTYEGAPGWGRDAKSELFLLAVTALAGEDTFYEKAADRDARLTALAGRVALDDVAWLLRLVGWVRGEAQLRSAALMIAAEGVAARLAAGEHGGNRALVTAALRRPDEPGELGRVAARACCGCSTGSATSAGQTPPRRCGATTARTTASSSSPTSRRGVAGRGEDPTSAVPARVPVYTWNVAGYRYGHGPSGAGNRHTFGGLTDGAFTAIPLLERGRDAPWPF